MNHKIIMQVPDSADDLPEVERSDVFCEAVLLADLLEKTPVDSQFQQQINLIFVVEIAVHFENVGVVAEGLNFYLLQKLRLHPRFLNLSFAYHLYRADEPRLHLPAHVNITKTPLSQLTTHFEPP